MRYRAFSKFVSPLLKNDAAYHVLVTKSADFMLTKHMLKITRIQLSKIRHQWGTGILQYDLGGGLKMGFDLSNDNDAFFYDHLVRNGVYEKEVTTTLSGLITPNTTFVDIGANIGYFTILFSKLVRETYSFEPIPATFERLLRNVKLNNLENVKAFPYALSNQRSKLALFESSVSSGHDSSIKRSEHGKSIVVDAVTLDEILPPSAGDIVIKIDNEGSEMEAAQGAMGLIRSGRVSVIVLEWARRIYPQLSNLRDRFELYSSLGSVEVLDPRFGRHKVNDRHELPDYCNLLIEVQI